MTQINLCAVEDADRLLQLVARCHEERGLETTEEHRQTALMPLLEGSPLGAAWMFGPLRAPVGYLVMSFSWSLEFGGMSGWIDELWIRPSVRGRGIASEALHGVSSALRDGGLRALHFHADREAEATRRLFLRNGFAVQEDACLMTRRM